MSVVVVRSSRGVTLSVSAAKSLSEARSEVASIARHPDLLPDYPAPWPQPNSFFTRGYIVADLEWHKA